MAIYFPNSDSLLLLVPKTGSKWVREAVSAGGLFHVMLGPDVFRGHGYLSHYGRGFRNMGAFVRHPVSWHRSYWAYRNSTRSNWDPRWKIDRTCAASSFEQYVDNVCLHMPQFTSFLFSSFVGAESDAISFVGRQENLVNDLCAFLRACGEDFDEEAVRELAPVNADEARVSVGDEIVRKLCASESEAIRRFYYD